VIDTLPSEDGELVSPWAVRRAGQRPRRGSLFAASSAGTTPRDRFGSTPPAPQERARAPLLHVVAHALDENGHLGCESLLGTRRITCSSASVAFAACAPPALEGLVHSVLVERPENGRRLLFDVRCRPNPRSIWSTSDRRVFRARSPLFSNFLKSSRRRGVCFQERDASVGNCVPRRVRGWCIDNDTIRVDDSDEVPQRAPRTAARHRDTWLSDSAAGPFGVRSLAVKKRCGIPDDSANANDSSDPDKPAERPWQPSLFAQSEASPDADFARLNGISLDDTAWSTTFVGWLAGLTPCSRS